MNAKLARITIYPIKSLPGVAVATAKVLSSGALEHDRRWALCDSEGKTVNAKRSVAIHPIRATFDASLRVVSLAADGGPEPVTVDLHDERETAEAWFSAYFGFAITLVENPTAGYPDDTDAPGPTVVSTATLEEVTTWFPGLNLEETRARFRANLEVEGVAPFWEDQLVGPDDRSVAFQIGTVKFEGVNPCQRCAVPTRDSRSGAVTSEFAKRFAERRRAALPPWAAASRFSHYYRLSVNTRPPVDHHSGAIATGDEVRISLVDSL